MKRPAPSTLSPGYNIGWNFDEKFETLGGLLYQNDLSIYIELVFGCE